MDKTLLGNKLMSMDVSRRVPTRLGMVHSTQANGSMACVTVLEPNSGLMAVAMKVNGGMIRQMDRVS